MPTRRQFVQNALFLPAALTIPRRGDAQDTPKTDAAPTTEVFADFEGGNFDGWTVEGDAFGTAPATDALFPGKIRGFAGRGFACSLHPRKGNAATGKLISREFVIEKPFITFKIGGGNHPNQACLNLIVDDKIVRTATGDGTPNLTDASWDVSDLKGRKTHIEIVDATASDQRGYIMADDIRFTDRIQYRGYGWRDKSIEPFFITRAKIWQGIDFRNGESPFPFELLESDIQRAIDRIVVAMHDPDMTLPPVAQRSVERIGPQIVRKVDATIAALNLPKVNKFTRQWLIAEGVCEWVRNVVIFDHKLATVQGQDDYRRLRATSKYILGMETPAAVCWGIAVTVRDLARAAGLKCDFVSVNLRHPFTPVPQQKDRNHGIACFIFDGDKEVIADVSSAIGEDKGKQIVTKKTQSNWILPRHPEAWELFLSRINTQLAENMEVSFDKQNVHVLLSMPYQEWSSIDIRYLFPLTERYQKWEANREV